MPGKTGRMVTCGATSGPNASVDIRPFYARQHSVLGSFMGGRAELLRVLELVEAGKLRPIVGSRVPAERKPPPRIVTWKSAGSSGRLF